MNVNDLPPDTRMAVINAANGVLRLGEGCTCLDCQTQAVEIIIGVVLAERETCATVAHAAALYSGCPYEPIADEIAGAVRAGGVVGSPA